MKEELIENYTNRFLGLYDGISLTKLNIFTLQMKLHLSWQSR